MDGVNLQRKSTRPGLVARLTVARGPNAGLRSFVDRSRFIVGSAPDAHLVLTDDTVAPHHLELSCEQETLRVRDLGSSSGSSVGAVRITDAALTASTAITIGRSTLEIEIDLAADCAAPPVTFGNAIGRSRAMRQVFASLERMAREDLDVIVYGESGVGKEVLVQALHQHSLRAKGAFVALDCGAIPAALIESELFGYERGAFTGASQSREGAFVQADGGTLFLDELGELPLDLQPKLLRVLETREVRPVGSNATRKVDVRIVAATNRNLTESVQSGAFRSDLYYRLAVLGVHVPPLRDRASDVLLLAEAFLRRIPGQENAVIPSDLAARLAAHSWPGNVRELRNVIARYAVFGADASQLFETLLTDASGPTGDDLSHLTFREARLVALERFEKAYLPAVLARTDNVVQQAAKHAGVGRASFHRMLARVRDGRKVA